MTKREEIARIIDPTAWINIDGDAIAQVGSDEALVKADAILALSPPEPTEMRQDIAQAVLAERKACAKLAGDTALAWNNTLGGRMIGDEVAKAILARPLPLQDGDHE